MVKVIERQLVSFDWAIKRLLRSKANFVVLEGFLSELLFDDIKILEVLESESNKDDEKDKFNRVDIKVKNSKGEIIIVEVQFNDEVDFFQRVLYATSKTICEHLDKGDDYANVVKVISINILYFDLGEGKDYIYKGQTTFHGFHNKKILKLNTEQKEVFKKNYPDKLFPEFYIIKVNNFDNVAKSSLDEWMYLLKNSAVKSSFKAKGIKEASKALDKMKMTKEERLAYDRYLDKNRSARSQYNTAIMKGERRGIKKGEKRGIKKGQLQLLSKLIKQGLLTTEQAAKQMNMTVKQFEEKLNSDI
jgi:predicted transposase/invertase (TIGR01784 family)